MSTEPRDVTLNWDTEEPLERALLYLYEKQYDLAEEELFLLKEESESAELYVALVRLYVLLHNPDKAEALVQEGLAKFPESADLHAGYAALCNVLNRVDDAREWWAKGHAIDPEAVQVLSVGAALSVIDGDLDAAEAALRRCAEHAPSYVLPHTLLMLGNVLAEQHKVSSSQEKLDDCVSTYQRVFELNPHWEMGYETALQRLIYLADPQIALDVVKRGLEHVPHSHQVMFFSVRPLVLAGRLEDAQDVVAELADYYRGDVNSLIVIADQIAEFDDHLTFAAEMLEFADKNHPNNLSVARCFAELHRRMGDEAQATSWQERVKRLESGQPSADGA